MPTFDPRTQYWLDGLEDAEERAEALKVLTMEGGSQASAYVAVATLRVGRRLDELLDGVHNLGTPWYIQAAKGLGLAAAGVITAVASWKTGIRP